MQNLDFNSTNTERKKIPAGKGGNFLLKIIFLRIIIPSNHKQKLKKDYNLKLVWDYAIIAVKHDL